jgi:hypothetical protein
VPAGPGIRSTLATRTLHPDEGGLTNRNKTCTHFAFADLGKLGPRAMTGAKLLGMHETETSPIKTELPISACAQACGDAGVVYRSYADDV